MNKLDKAVKEFNMIYTDTVQPSDMCRTNYHFKNQEVNFENSVSLRDVRDTILGTHKQMLEEYGKLESLEFGDGYEVLDFFTPSKSERVRELKMVLDNPSLIDADENFVYFVDNEGKLESFVTNGYYLLDDNFKKKDLNISDEIIKEYLDLFGKYKPLIDFFNYYKTYMIFGDGRYKLYSTINTTKNRFNSPIRNLELYGHLDQYLSNGNTFTINTLGSGKVDLERSSLTVEDENMKLSAKEYNEFLESIYVNKKHLNQTLTSLTGDNFEKVLRLK